MSWRELALCANEPPNLFFTDDPTTQHQARTICGDCTVRVECLDHAITNNITDGIFGGTTEALREWIRSQYLQSPDHYRGALQAAMQELDYHLGRAERPLQPARTCPRCGANVPEGRWPIDRNGNQSTCGLASTFNKGCRCDPCRQAKSDNEKNRPRTRPRRQHPPRGGSATVDTPTPQPEETAP